MWFWLLIDVLGAGLLFSGGLLAIAAWHRPAAGRSIYWLLAGAGLLYLAFDERLSLHERIGRTLYDAGVPTPPGVNHLDDAVLIAFAAAGAVITALFVREIARHRQVIPALALGGAFTAGGLAVDAFAPVDGVAPRIEELCELAGQASLFIAMWLRWAEGRSPVLAPIIENESLPAYATIDSD